MCVVKYVAADDTLHSVFCVNVVGELAIVFVVELKWGRGLVVSIRENRVSFSVSGVTGVAVEVGNLVGRGWEIDGGDVESGLGGWVTRESGVKRPGVSGIIGKPTRSPDVVRGGAN